jgi:hypothetical protein
MIENSAPLQFQDFSTQAVRMLFVTHAEALPDEGHHAHHDGDLEHRPGHAILPAIIMNPQTVVDINVHSIKEALIFCPFLNC